MIQPLDNFDGPGTEHMSLMRVQQRPGRTSRLPVRCTPTGGSALLGHANSAPTSAGCLGVLPLHSQVPVVSQATVIAAYPHALQISTGALNINTI